MIGLAPPGDYQPHPTYEADAQGHGSGAGQGGGDPRELGLRQDGFLPLLHVADVSLTLTVWGEKAWRVPK